MAEEGKKEEAETKKIVHTYPLVRQSDMLEELKAEAVELVVTACEKHPANNEGSQTYILYFSGEMVHFQPKCLFYDMKMFVSALQPLKIMGAARMIKESMDKKFGPSWHVVVGEGYGFEISYECSNLLYMYFGGNVAVCIWKCS